MSDPRRRTPRTDLVLADPSLAPALGQLGRARVKQTVGEVLERCRTGGVEPADVVPTVLASLPSRVGSQRAVINATGVVVHTNLGRAPLSEAARDAVAVATGVTNVEFDLATGQRGPRGGAALAALAAAVPAAGGVHVVNNGAAALSLVTCALARDRTVVVARGELVEIGDGFRIPDLLESMGARLQEVGTTNRVHVEDYAQALDDTTAFVLKVHPSNFRVEGFTAAVPVSHLAGLGAPVVVDIGSGLLEPHPRLPREPDATTSLRAGAALVTASGDKLFGGPQCGLLLGEAGLVEQLRRHPFARALRVDKLTLAALEATLTGPPSPVAQMLASDLEDLVERARRMAHEIGPDAEAVRSEGRVGGGGAPGVVLDSAAIALPPRLVAPLRDGDPAVVGHVRRGRLLLDLLAVPAQDDQAVARAVLRAMSARES